MNDQKPRFTYWTPPAQGAAFEPMHEERFVRKVVPRIEEGTEHLDSAAPAARSGDLIEGDALTAEKVDAIIAAGDLEVKENA